MSGLGNWLLRPGLALLSLLALPLLALLSGWGILLHWLAISAAHIRWELELHIDVSSIEVVRCAELEADLVIDIEVDVVAGEQGAQEVVGAIIGEIVTPVVPLVGMGKRIVPVDSPWSLRWVSVVVRHRVSLEMIVSIFMDWVVLTMLSCSLLLGLLLGLLGRLRGL